MATPKKKHLRIISLHEKEAEFIAHVINSRDELAETLANIATIAHCEGIVGMDSSDALAFIRCITLQHWNKNANKQHVLNIIEKIRGKKQVTSSHPKPKFYQEAVSKIANAIKDPNGCSKHGMNGWVGGSIRQGGYCRLCTKEKYESASRCPICGTKKGFAPGTGDCNCEED